MKNILICLSFVGLLLGLAVEAKIGSLSSILSSLNSSLGQQRALWLTPVDITQGYYFDPEVHSALGGNGFLKPQVHNLAQDLTDSVAMEFFKLPFGQQVCAILLANDEKKLVHFMGLSEPAAKTIASICKAQATIQRPLDSRDRSVSHAHVFSYVFVPKNMKGRLDAKSDFSSYSVSNGLTIFQLDQEELALENLLLSFAHEVAILFDTLQYPYSAYFYEVDKLLKEAPGLKALAAPFRWDVMEAKGDQAVLLAAAANPEMNRALSVIRAVEIEKLVFSQFASRPEKLQKAFDKFFGQSCMERVEQAIKKMRNVRLEVWRVEGAPYDLDFGMEPLLEGESSSDDSYLDRRVNKAIKDFASAEVRTENGVESACTYFTKPRLGVDRIRLSRGPRSRWTEW